MRWGRQRRSGKTAWSGAQQLPTRGKLMQKIGDGMGEFRGNVHERGFEGHWLKWGRLARAMREEEQRLLTILGSGGGVGHSDRSEPRRLGGVGHSHRSEPRRLDRSARALLGHVSLGSAHRPLQLYLDDPKMVFDRGPGLGECGVPPGRPRSLSNLTLGVMTVRTIPSAR